MKTIRKRKKYNGMLDPVTKPQEPNMPSQSTLGSCIFDSYIYSSFSKMNDNKHIDLMLVRLGFFCLMEISTSLPTEFSFLFLLTIIS